MIEKNEMAAYLALRAAIFNYDAAKNNFIHGGDSDKADYGIACAEMDLAHQKLFKTIRANNKIK